MGMCASAVRMTDPHEHIQQLLIAYNTGRRDGADEVRSSMDTPVAERVRPTYEAITRAYAVEQEQLQAARLKIARLEADNAALQRELNEAVSDQSRQ